jgi:hypothetical protein
MNVFFELMVMWYAEVPGAMGVCVLPVTRMFLVLDDSLFYSLTPCISLAVFSKPLSSPSFA